MVPLFGAVGLENQNSKALLAYFCFLTPGIRKLMKSSRILSFVKRAARPPVTSLDADAIVPFQSIDDVVIVASFSPTGDGLLNAFRDLGEKYRDRYIFGLVAAASSEPQESRVHCFNNIDGIRHASSDFSRPSSLEVFVKKCAEPLIPQMTRRNELSLLHVRLKL